jgi:hypothetical protein
MVRDLVSANVSIHHVLEFFSSFRSSTPIHHKGNESKLSKSLGMQPAHVSKGPRHNSGLWACINKVNTDSFGGVEIVGLVETP